MATDKKTVNLTINNEAKTLVVGEEESLLDALRNASYYSVKYGCGSGDCGSCTVIIDGIPVKSCTLKAVEAEGKNVITLEGLSINGEPGVIQRAFMDTGAIQCGYCSPAMILSSKALLDKNPSPTDDQIRKALNPVLCRCTGYVRGVDAVKRAAAVMRGEKVAPFEHISRDLPDDLTKIDIPKEYFRADGSTSPLPPLVYTPGNMEKTRVIGKSKVKVDAKKLALGKPVFTDDIKLPGMLYAAMLTSPHAHALIKKIDASKARALPGVHAVLTHEDLPRIKYASGGQSYPQPEPYDQVSLDNKVRFVGDRVAFVAAETEAIAQKALELIEVEYEELPAVLDSREAMKPGAPIIHDEPEYVNFADSDPTHNKAAAIRIDIGDVEQGFAEADRIYEQEYEVPKVQQAHIEPHVALSYWDADGRLVIYSSTQVPFHARRMLAPLLKLPVKRIRVIKPRIGGGFGGKQEVLIEDVVAHLTIATGKPVLYQMSREEEFIASRSRHPMRIKMRTGVKQDGTITANEMIALSDTGAYGCHALTVTGNTGQKSMALYVGDGKYRLSPNIRFYADIVYTNTPPAGAYRGYGVPQGFWPLERHMEMIARDLGLDPLGFRLKNALRSGEYQPFSTSWNEGREPRPEIVETVGLEECVREGAQAIGWEHKYGNPEWHEVPGKPHLKRGIGVAMVMQGTAIPYLDMGGASLKLNDDGSFNLLVGATDLGTGSDTILAQMQLKS